MPMFEMEKISTVENVKQCYLQFFYMSKGANFRVITSYIEICINEFFPSLLEKTIKSVETNLLKAKNNLKS